jgi:hypothetical protein
MGCCDKEPLKIIDKADYETGPDLDFWESVDWLNVSDEDVD